MKRFVLLAMAAGLLLAACVTAIPAAGEGSLVRIYALDEWGCCGDWKDYLEENGYQTELTSHDTLDDIKKKYHIPQEFNTCHTAIVNGYIIEGHVPVREIERLLKEKPDVIGLAVADMPIGSPGMEIEGFENEAFDVVTFDSEGRIEIFQSYSGE